ncbi:MAG: flagellin, partial [Hyphomicrobiales bacterium]
PVNYFTAASLNDRSSQLTGLLDGISNGIQTIQTASKGIDGITKLVGSLQSTLKQAQSDAAQNRPTLAGTALSTAAEKVATNKSLKDIALDKKVGVAGGTAAAATSSDAGNLAVDITGNTALNVQITTGDPATPTSTTNVGITLTANTTVRDVVNAINGSGVATAFVDEKGQLNIKGTGSETLGVGIGVGATTTDAETASETDADSSNAAFNLAADARETGVDSSNVTSAVRSNLIQQYNDLRNQIDELAKDSSFNGINLLKGDRLSIQFNEKTGKNQTKLDIQGSDVTADNLGITKAGNTQDATQINFQNDTDLDKATQALTGALTSLKSLSSTFGANLSVAQTRQDFTRDLADTLSTGASNLVNVDANSEAANLLALQTRQQLSQTALSLSNQSEQAVLRLF